MLTWILPLSLLLVLGFTMAAALAICTRSSKVAGDLPLVFKDDFERG